MITFRRWTLLLVLSFVCSLPAPAQTPKLEFAPGAQYDAGVPSLKQVAGHEFGERVTAPEDILRYLKALHEAAPDRTRLVKYAESWEGRALHALVIASPDRIQRLDAIKAGLQRLANPAALASGEAEQLIKQLPVVVALVHGVHGNEISSGEAAMAEAYHLLAAQNDANVDLIRREAVVIIDPMQNPDGRARFVFQNLLGQAASPDDEPASAEHDEPWPGGRSNHYLFDLNRDWFAQTQPESQGRVRLLLEWMPHVVVDLHEMGGDSTYYFPPAADPGNPHTTRTQAAWLEQFGQNNAARFDERGFAYFNREVFDAFYPGYGVSWPMAQGAIGMTFEMASARGLVFRRQDETNLSYLDGAVRHFTSALMTATTAARNREKMLRDYLEFRRNAGAGATKAYVIPPGNDPGQTMRLVRTLMSNGIVVHRAEEPISEAKLAACQFFQGKDNFEEIELPDGSVYYLHDVEADRGRQKQQIEFAAVNGKLVLATNEKLLLRAIANLNGQAKKDRLTDDPSFQSLSRSLAPHFLTVWVDQSKLNDDWHFKHYWLMSKVSDLKNLRAGIFDLEMQQG
jgi:hypothetical protein